MKIQKKTTILFTVLTGTIFLILNITVYIFISSSAHQDFNKRLELRARLSAKYRFEQEELSTQALSELQQQYLERLPGEETIVLPLDRQNRLAAPAPKELRPSYITRVIAGGGATVYYQENFRHYAGLLYTDESGKFLVVESATNRYGQDMMLKLRTVKISQFILAMIIIYAVGLYFSRRTFQPFREIISRVKEISRGNLHLRLKEQKGGDEIAELTATFNQMLSRLETAFEAQNNFISHASHELRTPLTAIIGEADYVLSKERSVEAYQASLQQIAQQADKLQTLSKGLLALAQTGFNRNVQSWKTVRLDQLLFDVKDDCDAILPGNRIRISMEDLPYEEEGVSINGNYDLLKVAVNNIVLNACKYSNNEPVSLQLTVEQDSIAIVVTDPGIGIPPEELKYIYDPFFRASNTKNYEGYGIGMPLSNNIIHLHRGRIDIQSEVGVGTRVRIILPLR